LSAPPASEKTVKDVSTPGILPDEELVVRAKEGDLLAMDELVSRHHASVYRVCLGILGDEDSAADSSQEAFMKAIRALGGYRGDASFRTWLLAIAANEARGFLRRRARRREQDIEKAGPVASTNPDPEEGLMVREGAERVRELIAALPEKQRLAVTLRIFEGLSFKEVGELIGSSEGAARVNYHHGIRRLRELVE
jgi:RNA polymerase sigma-70 factor (ECF subfamily)